MKNNNGPKKPEPQEEDPQYAPTLPAIPLARLSRRGLLAVLVMLEDQPMTPERADLEVEVLCALQFKPNFLDEAVRQRAS